MGTVRTAIGDDGVHFGTSRLRLDVKWNDICYIVETERWLIFITSNQAFWCFITKADMAEQADCEELIEYCQQNGVPHFQSHIDIPYQPEMPDEPPEDVKKMRRFAKRMAIVIPIIVLLMNFTNKQSGYQETKRRQRAAKYQQETTEEYQFPVADFTDYLPLAEQVSRLNTLGIDVPSDIVESLNKQMEEFPYSKEWIEGDPYRMILTWLGSPQYDYDNWEITAYPEQFYWFDLEGFEIQQDYIDILGGINVLADGDFTITEITTDDRRVNWENGSGILAVQFSLNDRSDTYRAAVESDWLDIEILGYINQQLETIDTDKRIYIMHDNGQGCIFFIADSEWADAFSEKTQIELLAGY